MIRIRPEVFALVEDATPDSLEQALQYAVELEHATMPPYLYALYSLGSNNRGVATIIREIVIEEMLHMLLAGNLLRAVSGRSPRINSPDFVPSYPGPLPGAVADGLSVSLKRYSLDHLKNVFLAIEMPEHPIDIRVERHLEAAVPARTIGEFYGRIRALFEREGDALLKDRTGAGQLERDSFDIKQKIMSARDAIDAIDLIVQQGEGTANDPKTPVNDGFSSNSPFAHYYRFDQLVKGRLKERPGTTPETPPTERYFHDASDPIAFDASKVLPVIDNPRAASYPANSTARGQNDIFNRAYTSILADLQRAYDGSPASLDMAVTSMMFLPDEAATLMAIEIGGGLCAGPSFEYLP